LPYPYHSKQDALIKGKQCILLMDSTLNLLHEAKSDRTLDKY
jgi:hypothetical protein